MEKINIAELLKNCPTGMELECTLIEGLEFDSIVDNEYLPIRCRIKNPCGGYNVYNFTKYGCWLDATFAKCIIFPKGKTTWEGFVSPCKFKDGDIVVTTLGNIAIIRKLIGEELFYIYGLMVGNSFYKDETAKVFVERLASEEEKQKLFDAIKDNGYKWNAETKKLEKLIEPKFKVGDRIVHKQRGEPFTITEITDGCYKGGTRYAILITQQDNFELAPNKFDITTLVPFESRVLVRDTEEEKWKPAFWGYYDDNNTKYYPHETVGGNCFQRCIPYDKNEHLLNTTNDCDDFYKTWEK